MRSIPARLETRREIDGETGCWNWTGGKDSYGYGQMKVDGRQRLVHRVSHIHYKGSIPTGQCVLHRCDNRACYNPEHLYLGTQSENIADMIAKGRARKAQRKGEAHSQAKLTEADVMAIRSATGVLQRDLASQYGVCQQLVSEIRSGKRWSHVQVVGAE